MAKARVQDTPRVDAVAMSYLDGAAVFRLGEHQALAVHAAGADVCDLCLGGNRGERLQLVRLQNGYGHRGPTLFVCPACGGRARHVYVTGEGFRCRECAGLCYQSQLTRRRRALVPLLWFGCRPRGLLLPIYPPMTPPVVGEVPLVVPASDGAGAPRLEWPEARTLGERKPVH